MVLGPQGPGRVGRRRVNKKDSQKWLSFYLCFINLVEIPYVVCLPSASKRCFAVIDRSRKDFLAEITGRRRVNKKTVRNGCFFVCILLIQLKLLFLLFCETLPRLYNELKYI